MTGAGFVAGPRRRSRVSSRDRVGLPPSLDLDAAALRLVGLGRSISSEARP